MAYMALQDIVERMFNFIKEEEFPHHMKNYNYKLKELKTTAQQYLYVMRVFC